MTSKIKIGALACSSIARRSVLPAILSSEQFELVAVSSRDECKGLKYAHDFNCSCCSYDELVKNPDIDAVYISLPVGLHYSWALRCLRAGKHVLVEKTMTESFKNTMSLIDFAEKNNLIAMEALSYQYHPHYNRVLDLLTGGRIGEIRHVEAFFGFPFLPDNDIRNDRSLGGGAILDTLIYPLSFCLQVINGKVKNVAFSIGKSNGSSVDTHGVLQMSGPQCSAQLGYGFGHSYRNEYHVWGESARLYAQRVFSRPPAMSGEIEFFENGKIEKTIVEPADQFQYMLFEFSTRVRNKILTCDREPFFHLRHKIISAVYDKTKFLFSGEEADTTVTEKITLP